jgi:Zn-dependent protease with chaperone function
MNAEARYRSGLMLFGFVSACALASAVRGLVPLWARVLAVCCYSMRMMEKAPGFLGVGLAALVFFGAALFIARLWKTRRFIAQLNFATMAVPPARLARLLGELNLRPHTVVLATDVPLALCAGLFPPRICLSTGLADALTDRELKAVLLHEDHHRRHCDPLRGLMAEALAAMLFFLPIAAELRDACLTSLELAADRYAARLAGRPALAGALHKLLAHPRAVQLPATGLAGLSATNARIVQLLGETSPPLRLSSLSLLVSSMMLMLACVLA